MTLLDYGAGNVRSVRNAIRYLGFDIKDVIFLTFFFLNNWIRSRIASLSNYFFMSKLKMLSRNQKNENFFSAFVVVYIYLYLIYLFLN